MGVVQGQSKSKGTGTEVLLTETSFSFCRPEKVEHIIMCPWGLACNCARFYVKEFSNTENFSFQNVRKKCVGLTPSNWSMVSCLSPSFSLEISC